MYRFASSHKIIAWVSCNVRSPVRMSLNRGETGALVHGISFSRPSMVIGEFTRNALYSAISPSEHGNFHSEAKSSGAAANKSAINFIEAKHKQEEKDKSIATLVRPSGQSPSRQPVIYLVENHGENHNGTNNNLAVTLFNADEDDSGADHLND